MTILTKHFNCFFCWRNQNGIYWINLLSP